MPDDPSEDRLRETIGALQRAGIPLADDHDLQLDDQDVDRNRLLRGYLVHDAWEHLDVLGPQRAA